MKKLQILILTILVSIVLLGCNSDDDSAQSQDVPLSFETITRADIEALKSTMFNGEQNASNNSGVLWEAGKILVYNTTENRLGKLKVLGIDPDNDFQLTIAAVTYNEDGSVYNETDALIINSTSICSLNTMTINDFTLANDFLWNRINETTIRFTAYSGFTWIEWSAAN